MQGRLMESCCNASKSSLTVELPNIFAAATTYTDRETAVGVHIDHYAFARRKRQAAS
jgi:hypothetical protein